jgi:hypothetical protein
MIHAIMPKIYDHCDGYYSKYDAKTKYSNEEKAAILINMISHTIQKNN